MDSHDNQKKREAGSARAKSFSDRLQEAKENGFIKDFTQGKRRGYDEYDATQFYEPFEIEFEDGTLWAVYSTTEWKDRYKMAEWDAFNVKQIEDRIERCYITLSKTGEKQERDANDQTSRRKNGRVFSAIDAVLLDNQFFQTVEENYYAIRGLTPQQRANTKGASFEDHVTRVIEDIDNLIRWKTENTVLTGNDHNLFLKIVEGIGIDKDRLISLDATREVPKSSAGGKPKTDVIITAHFCDETEEMYTISCKRSTKDIVSFMQFDAIDLVNALGIDDPEVIDVLRKLQDCGGKEKLKREYGANAERTLTTGLAPYLQELTTWILSGVANQSDPLQVANWILSRRDHPDGSYDLGFHSIEEYCSLCLRFKKQFNTPFQWTYKTTNKKTRTKQLQCKGPVITD